MRLEQAKEQDLDKLAEFYRYVIENSPNMLEYVKWIYGLHPSDEMIKGYIDSGCMFMAEGDGKLTAAVAVTFCQGDDYHVDKWKVGLNDDEVAVVHILGVNPDMQRMGVAKQVMQEVMRLAQERGKKAVRLDALMCNSPAQRLYKALGFAECGNIKMYAANLGWADFILFEKLI